MRSLFLVVGELAPGEDVHGPRAVVGITAALVAYLVLALLALPFVLARGAFRKAVG